MYKQCIKTASPSAWSKTSRARPGPRSVGRTGLAPEVFLHTASAIRAARPSGKEFVLSLGVAEACVPAAGKLSAGFLSLVCWRLVTNRGSTTPGAWTLASAVKCGPCLLEGASSSMSHRKTRKDGSTRERKTGSGPSGRLFETRPVDGHLAPSTTSARRGCRGSHTKGEESCQLSHWRRRGARPRKAPQLRISVESGGGFRDDSSE